jgi:hypothetical protein
VAYLSLDPVSAAVYSTLNVAALTALAPGGVTDYPKQGTTFPFVWYEVREEEGRGFGMGGFPEVTLRVHAFSTYEGLKEAQSVIQKAIQLLKDQALTVTGYTQAGLVFYDETVSLPDQIINGVSCHELVASFRIYVEETA